ncbi:MAG: DUF6851 domain-containing protein [Chitinophagaceae bacterium]
MSYGKPIALQWNQLILDAVKYSGTSAPLAARALAMVHTAMYDAWSVYNSKANSTSTALYIKAPQHHCNKENVRKAFSYAAYRVLMDLFWLSLPTENKNMFTDFMCGLTYNTDDTCINTSSPQGIGNLAARMIIENRNGDGSNPHGTLAMPAWSDYTGYQPVNTADKINDISRWQPLKKQITPGNFKIQHFLLPHWGLVKPFALHYNWQSRPDRPYNQNDAQFKEQAQEVLDISACLTDEQKAIAEYWADGKGTYTTAGHWCEIAQHVLRHEDRNTPCIKLLFALSNAMLDASIACWESKHYYDSVRPVTAIRYFFENNDVQAWAGCGKGTRTIKGKDWQPYIDTPPFAEYPSAHSSLSRAAAVVLKNFTCSDVFEGCYMMERGCSNLEPHCNVPCMDINLGWPTFSDAAVQAGMAGLYGGIHFKKGIEAGQKLGNSIGTQSWEKAMFLFNDKL